jgi:hypothetical protein
MLHGKYYFMVCHNKYFFCGWFYSVPSGNHKEKKIRYFEGMLMLSCTQHTFGCAKRKKERKKAS